MQASCSCCPSTPLSRGFEEASGGGSGWVQGLISGPGEDNIIGNSCISHPRRYNHYHHQLAAPSSRSFLLLHARVKSLRLASHCKSPSQRPAGDDPQPQTSTVQPEKLEQPVEFSKPLCCRFVSRQRAGDPRSTRLDTPAFTCSST